MTLRCYDHKFDPIPTKDYYSLAGIFLSADTRYGGGTKRPKTAADKGKLYLTLGDALDPEVAKAQGEIRTKFAKLEQQVNASRKRVKTLQADIPAEFHKKADAPIPESDDPKLAKTIRQYQSSFRILQRREVEYAAMKQLLGEEPSYAIGVQDAKKITDAKILIRGEVKQPGEVAKRGFLSAVGDLCESPETRLESIGSSQSGRLELAAWLVHEGNPFTARVAVNRIWQHVMGRGLFLPRNHP